MLPQKLIPTDTPITLDESRAVEFRDVNTFIEKQQKYVVYTIWGLYVLSIFIYGGSFWDNVQRGIIALILAMATQRLPLFWITKTRYSCPHTSKFLEPFESWKCPTCERINSGKKTQNRYSYIIGCYNCNEAPSAFKSPWTNELIYLSRPNKSEFVAVKVGDKWEEKELSFPPEPVLLMLVTRSEETQIANYLRDEPDALKREAKINLWKRSIVARIRSEGVTDATFIANAMKAADRVVAKYTK